MAKRVCDRPDWFKAPNITDIFSVSACISEFFLNDYIPLWKHNDYWIFDSPEIIQTVVRENSIDLQEMKLFYCEEHELELTEETWEPLNKSLLRSNIPSGAKAQLILCHLRHD
jgi:hypothetical protein